MFDYVQTDPFFRKGSHNKLTFSMFYAFSENFVLPISHDEVVHGKKSLIDKMYGDYNQKFDCYRAFLSYMMAHPGKKLTFMGVELAQFKEWDNGMGIDFCLMDFEKHRKTKEFVKELNNFYALTPELYEDDFSWNGFEWIIPDDYHQNIVAFKRKDKKGNEIICVVNFSPEERRNYKIGVPSGTYSQIFNSSLQKYGGGTVKKQSSIKTLKQPMHNQKECIKLNLAGYSAIFLKKINLNKGKN